MSRTAAGQGGWGGFSLWGRAGPGKSSTVLARCSVVCCVFCTMQPSAQQGELLHHLLHSPLVHTLSAKTEGGDKHEVGGLHGPCRGIIPVGNVGHSCQGKWHTNLRICWLKFSFCSGVTRAEGKPSCCMASLIQMLRRLKQCLFKAKRISAK